MIGGTIKFAASIDYDGDCTFDVTISEGSIKTHVFFYGDSETWVTFGEALQAFPLQSQDVVVFEAGAPEFNTQGYAAILLKVYCYNRQGHTAIQVIVDNNEPLPIKERVEFSILAEAASLNKLGIALANWQIENGTEIVWEARLS